ncbi:MAG: hypothetical protein WC445_00765 [Patescibacteria group bacterium]
MNSERKFAQVRDDEKRMAERRQAERERVFKSYVKNLGLKEEDFAVGKIILDVGAGRFANFADKTRQMNLGCQVVSLDRGEFADTSFDGIDQKQNLKIGGTDFENLNLKEKLGLKQEPQFDLIVSHSSAPYTIANEEDQVFIDERGVARENLELLRQKVGATVESALRHLKPGGRAVFYPVFKSEVVDFGNKNGGRRDFRAWRKALETALKELIQAADNDYIFYFEDIKTENKHIYQRLTIIRKT